MKKIRSQPTYEELKHNIQGMILIHNGFSAYLRGIETFSHDSNASRDPSSQPTYEELKQIDFAAMPCGSGGSQPTYEELKPGLPEQGVIRPSRSQPTYEELKPTL